MRRVFVLLIVLFFAAGCAGIESARQKPYVLARSHIPWLVGKRVLISANRRTCGGSYFFGEGQQTSNVFGVVSSDLRVRGAVRIAHNGTTYRKNNPSYDAIAKICTSILVAGSVPYGYGRGYKYIALTRIDIIDRRTKEVVVSGEGRRIFFSHAGECSFCGDSKYEAFYRSAKIAVNSLR